MPGMYETLDSVPSTELGGGFHAVKLIDVEILDIIGKICLMILLSFL